MAYRRAAVLNPAGDVAQWFSTIRSDENMIENGFNREQRCGSVTQDAEFGIGGKACCGEHPFRIPYKPNGGQHGCCTTENGVGKIFGTDRPICCADGSLTDFGQFC